MSWAAVERPLFHAAVACQNLNQLIVGQRRNDPVVSTHHSVGNANGIYHSLFGGFYDGQEELGQPAIPKSLYCIHETVILRRAFSKWTGAWNALGSGEGEDEVATACVRNLSRPSQADDCPFTETAKLDRNEGSICCNENDDGAVA